MDKFRLVFNGSPDEPAPQEYDTEQDAIAAAYNFTYKLRIPGKMPIALWRGDKQVYGLKELAGLIEEYKLDHQEAASGDE